MHLLSAYSAEIVLRIKIFVLKSVCEQNFVLFRHPGHELQRFENLVFSINLYGIVACSDVYTAAAYSIQMYSIVKIYNRSSSRSRFLKNTKYKFNFNCFNLKETRSHISHWTVTLIFTSEMFIYLKTILSHCRSL